LVSPIESDRRIAITTEEDTQVHIVENGREVPNGAPSATSQIFDVTVGQGFQFVPNMLNIFWRYGAVDPG
jgi:hypothetical protein